MKCKNQTALITGTSGGIGLELANLFAYHGYDSVLVARNADKLHEIQSTLQTRFDTRSTVIAADLSYLKTPRVGKNLKSDSHYASRLNYF
jgi:short-subunit dehydrogenase